MNCGKCSQNLQAALCNHLLPLSRASPVRSSRARACREETNALSEQLTTVTIRMRQAEIENIDLKKSKESFDQIIERKNREMMMKEEELKTYIAQQEHAAPGQTATTDPSLLARLRHLESENKDLQEALTSQKEASRNDSAEASGATSPAEENAQQQQQSITKLRADCAIFKAENQSLHRVKDELR